MSSQAHTGVERSRSGLGHWMDRVLVEMDRVGTQLEADSVHDVRVAIRRCRSMAEAFRELDCDESWQRMRRAGKSVFTPLGDLRDVQVMLEWVDKLAGRRGELQNLRKVFEERENALKDQARVALHDFDRARWTSWMKELPQRAAQLPPGSPVFEYLALERWHAAHDLHRRALRNRSKISLHQLRIGIKKFRYIVENFLPDHHQAWSADLKELQDLLGDVHDLDVLWDSSIKGGLQLDAQTRAAWRKAIVAERQKRIARYRKKMVGRESLWFVWRSALPQGQVLDDAVLAKFAAWAAFRDPDYERTKRVAKLALQLYDKLISEEILTGQNARARLLLRSAALIHAAGGATGGKSRHKKSARLAEKLAVPETWTADELRTTALIVRYQRGRYPEPNVLQGLPAGLRSRVEQLAGVLRLAEALAAASNGEAGNISFAKGDGCATVYLKGYDAHGMAGRRIAEARHLLETTCNLPIMVRGISA